MRALRQDGAVCAVCPVMATDSMGKALVVSEPLFSYISSWGLDRVTSSSSSGFDLILLRWGLWMGGRLGSPEAAEGCLGGVDPVGRRGAGSDPGGPRASVCVLWPKPRLLGPGPECLIPL